LAAYALPLLGWVLPLLLMLSLGMFSASRLKFLLVGSPFLALSLGRGIAGPAPGRSAQPAPGAWGQLLLGGGGCP